MLEVFDVFSHAFILHAKVRIRKPKGLRKMEKREWKIVN